MILALVLFLALGAFGNEKGDAAGGGQQNVETVSVEALYADTENGAKCQLNVGKQVTVIGQISKIYSRYYELDLLNPVGYQVNVYLPTEILAELSKDEFIAVTGSVTDTRNSGKYLKYDIKATKTESTEKMNSLFREFVAEKMDGGKITSAYSLRKYGHMIENYLSYITNNFSKEYIVLNDAELTEYLCGSWECGYFRAYYYDSIDRSEFEVVNIEIYDDGTLFPEGKSWIKRWSVSKGRLDSFMGTYPQYVYVLTDDIFLCDYHFFVRQK